MKLELLGKCVRYVNVFGGWQNMLGHTVMNAVKDKRRDTFFHERTRGNFLMTFLLIQQIGAGIFLGKRLTFS